MKGWKVERKVGRFKGFCHFPCFQTLLEKVGRLERWNSCIIPPIRAQFDRAEHRRREARREKCTRDKCTLPTIPLGPAGRRPARAYDDDDDDDESDALCTGWDGGLASPIMNTGLRAQQGAYPPILYTFGLLSPFYPFLALYVHSSPF